MDYRPVLLFVVAAMTLTVGCASDSEEVPEVDLTSSDHVLTDTDELRAGTFTSLGNGTSVTDELLVGTHPDTDVGTVPVTVTEITPDEVASDPDVAETGPFYEIHTTNGERVRTAPGEGFVVAVPVPDHLDENHLAPVVYTERAFTHDDVEAGWIGNSGTYDDQQGFFVIDAPSIGNASHPTKVGVVEHDTWTTRTTGPILSEIITEHLPQADEIDPDPSPGGSDTRTSGFGLATASASSPDVAQLAHRSNHDAEWNMICRLNSCNASNVTDYKQALEDSVEVYTDLNNDPRPSISTTTNSKFQPQTSTYKINVGTPPLGSDNCSDPGASPAWYDYEWNTLIICPGAGASSAAHELFHSMQWNLAPHYAAWDAEVAEGTAKLADNYEDPEEPGSIGLPDLTQPLSRWSYDAAHFYSHLIQDTSITFEDLGDLFDQGGIGKAGGILFEGLETWVDDKLSGDLSDAYWSFAKDLAYENDVPVADEDCRVDGDYGADAIKQTVRVNASDDTADVPEDDEFSVRLYGLESTVVNLSLEAEDYEPYRLTVEETRNDTNTRLKLYDDEAREFEPTGCRSEDLESAPTGAVELEVYERFKNASVLFSDVGTMDADYDSDEVGIARSAYFVNLTVEKLPEDEIPYPEAPDLAIEYPDDGRSSTAIDVLDNASIPGEDDDRLAIADPDPGSAFRTDEGNEIRATASDGNVTFEPRSSNWYGEDTFNYTVEDERTGLTDNGTVTVTRGIPTAQDDRVALNRSTAEAWEQESWSIGRADDVDPITVDVLANDDSAIEGAAIGSGDLDIASATADHGTAEVDFVDSTETIRYWPGPGGEEAWSSASDGLRHYVDHVTYTAENDAGLSDDAKVTVIYHRPADQEVPGASGTPGGTTCSITGSADGSAGMTLMRGEAPASYVKPANAESWTEIDAEGTPVVQATRGGHAVGWTVDEEGNTEAFRWSEDEGYQQLDSRGSASFALDVDQRGRAVGAELSAEGRSTAVQWGDERRALDGELEGASMATAIGGSTVAGVHGLTPQGGAGGPSGSLGCGDLGQGPPGSGDDPACPGGRFGSVGLGGTAQGFQGAIGPEGGLGETVELASDGEGPAVPRDTTRAGASTGMIPQDPSGPTCPTTAMMHTEEGTQTLAPPAGAAFSDALAITEDGYAAGLVGTGEARQAAMWAPDGDGTSLDEAIDLREGRTLVAAQAIVDDHLVALVEDDDAGVRPLALGLDRVQTLADAGDPAPLIGDEEETPRFEMEAGSASPGGRITLTLTFVNDDTRADRVEVDLPSEAPVTNEGWEIASTGEPENVEGDVSETTLEAWAESIPAGATVEASATFQVPEDAASTSYEYQASSTTVDGEEIQPTPTATFTVRG
jgi:hypothetical protein